MKLKYLLNDLTADMQALLDSSELSIDDPNIDHGDSGLKFMWQLLTKVSTDRAYDDNHPFFQNGKWERRLPYDGRKYCFYYLDKDGKETGHDGHVKTLLKAIKKGLK